MTAPAGPPALEATGLGRRHRRGWALRDCGFRLPAGRVCALIGPNGAGKTTLLGLAADLLTPSAGTVRVFGDPAGCPAARRRTAFLGQDKALYPRFTVAETLRLGRELNPSWDQEYAEAVVAAGAIPLGARVGALSGGQRTRVAFALALGKRPDLLLLDEPMADLDPLVRRATTDLLLTEAARRSATVVMSSHIVAELDGTCDYLVLVDHGTVRLAGDTAEILAAHRVLAARDTPPPGALTVGPAPARGDGPLVRLPGPAADGTPGRTPTLEELLLCHLGSPGAPPLLTRTANPAPRPAAA